MRNVENCLVITVREGAVTIIPDKCTAIRSADIDKSTVHQRVVDIDGTVTPVTNESRGSGMISSSGNRSVIKAIVYGQCATVIVHINNATDTTVIVSIGEIDRAPAVFDKRRAVHPADYTGNAFVSGGYGACRVEVADGSAHDVTERSASQI